MTHSSWWLQPNQSKHISQTGSFPQIGANIKNLWNHVHHPSLSFMKKPVSIVECISIINYQNVLYCSCLCQFMNIYVYILIYIYVFSQYVCRIASWWSVLATQADVSFFPRPGPWRFYIKSNSYMNYVTWHVQVVHHVPTPWTSPPEHVNFRVLAIAQDEVNFKSVVSTLVCPIKQIQTKPYPKLAATFLPATSTHGAESRCRRLKLVAPKTDLPQIEVYEWMQTDYAVTSATLSRQLHK